MARKMVKTSPNVQKPTASPFIADYTHEVTRYNHGTRVSCTLCRSWSEMMGLCAHIESEGGVARVVKL